MKLSFIAKLWIFSSLMVLNLFVIGAISTWDSKKLSDRLDDVALAQMPAIHKITQLDAVHDGIRGSVYRAILLSGNKDKKKLDRAREEFNEQRSDMALFLATFDRLALSEETLSAVEPAKALVDNYVATAGQIIETALAGKTDEAVLQLDSFEETFSGLSTQFMKLTRLVQAEAGRSAKAGEVLVARSAIIRYSTMGAGLAVALIVAVGMILDLRRSLRKLLNQLATEAEHVHSASGAVQQSSQSLSNSTVQQSAAIEETVASMEEMSAMLTQTNQQAGRSQEASDRGQTDAVKGVSVMAKMSSSMDEFQTSNQKLDGLVRLIGEIKEKTQVINEIVSETRLLSFNASIEAARAGSHGKGFAVVAEEVGKLAAMSGKAAGDIHTLLESSAAEVSQVVRDTQDRVVTGKGISDECLKMFKSMQLSLETIAKTTQMISSATQEQEIGVKQTNKAMVEMSYTTQTNSKSAEDLSKQAEELASGATELRKVIETLHESMLGGKSSSKSPGNEANMAAATKSSSRVLPFFSRKQTGLKKSRSVGKKAA